MEEETEEPTKLLDLKKLRKLISELELCDKKRNDYIEARWLNYVAWWDLRSRRAKKKYAWLRGAVVVAGALIPALVGLRELNVWSNYGWVFAVASIIASLVVAICAGIEGLFNFGGIWREKRAASELIKTEGFSFIQLSGDYARFPNHAQAYTQFADNVEKLIRSEIKDYIMAVSSNKNDKPPDGGPGSGGPSSPPGGGSESSSPSSPPANPS
jgi:hypothetical protein